MANRVCPVWVGYFLSCPLRKFFQNPKKILSPYVKEGMKVLDFGCAMGFFSLPLCQMVGPHGKVICVDIQQKMIESLRKRASKADLLERIETRICTSESFNLDDLEEEIDFVLASAVIHEVPEPDILFSKIYKVMKATGKFLVIEPSGHVSGKDFHKTILNAQNSGFILVDRPKIRKRHVALLEKAES
jgi:ubiquinone/menaquinone biosynthesis C-methylase UbiE